MSEINENAPSPVPYVLRVFTNESVKKGAAAAVAGLLVAAVSEAIWPSR
ncbi:hypothetical protein WMF04_24210 [Sorangium sp. So ce260]